MEGGENDYMTALNKKLQRGFTLVELLIVIALLAIIALIVIAAINPIEQRNRARDTGMRADGAQLISAIDRYFTARGKFPWVVQDASGAIDNSTTFGFISAADYQVGLCADDGSGGTDCSTVGANEGVLITTDELKPEFVNRNFIDAYVDNEVTGQLYVGKIVGPSESVYICYTPLSKSNRDTACESSEVYTLDAGDGTKASVTDTGDLAVCGAEVTDWDNTTGVGIGPLYVCIPE